MASEFDFDTFRRTPTGAQVDSCRVVDLMLIANWLDLDMPSVPKKKELREKVVNALQEKALLGATGCQGEKTLPGASPSNVPPLARVHTTVPTDPVNGAGLSAEELRLTFRFREMEWGAINLKVKPLELERQPRVSPQSPEECSPEGGFDASLHIALVPPFRKAEVDSYFCAFERIRPKMFGLCYSTAN